MHPLLQSFKHACKRTFAYIAKVIASESGEFLSTRRKAHLLHAAVYTRLNKGEKT